MANAIWVAGAPKVAQVNTETPANVEIGDIFTITLSNKTGETHKISFTATAATVQNVVEGLKALAVAAHTAATAPWDEVTCTEDDTKMTITGDTAGEPFWVATTATNGGAADTQTLADLNTTPCAGPNIQNIAENYLLGAIPGVEDAWIAGPMAGGTNTNIYGSNQVGVELASFTVQAGCNIAIGDPGRYLQIHATAVNLEAGGTSAGTICLDVDHSTSFNIRNCKAATAAGSYGLYLVGNGAEANTILTIASTNTGKISIAALAGEVANYTTISCYAGTLVIGSGTTMTTLNAGGGTIENNAAATGENGKINNEGATLTHAAGAVTNMYLNGGITYFNATATTGTIYVRPDATLDFSQDSRTKTITNPIQVSKGCTVRDPNGVVTNLRLYYVNCRPEDVTFEGPPNKTATWA